MSADTVFTNGLIYTVDSNKAWVSAVAIKNGRFIAVGKESDIAHLIGPSTEVIDLAGRMAMPGMMDIHNHVLIGGQAECYELRLPGGYTISEIADSLRKAAEAAAPGAWIVGGMWGTDLLDAMNTDAGFAELNEASLGHPVLLRDDTYHYRWLSSAALSSAGITQDTPNPPNGEIGRDPISGKLTGILTEAAAGLAEHALDASGHFTPQMNQAAIARAISLMNSFGLTAFQDAASMLPVLSGLKTLDDQGELSIWAVCSIPSVEPGFLFGKSGDELVAIAQDYRSAHVLPNYTKVWLDGVPGTKTAAFHEPYVADPVHGCCFRGSTLFSVPELIQWLQKCEKQNLGVKIHAVGDAAVQQALDAIEVVRLFNGPTSLTHQIAHAGCITPEDMPRFVELGVAADLSPGIPYPTAISEASKFALGEERGNRWWPNRDLKEAGVLMAGGSDWPVVTNPNPWYGIQGMVTRKNPDGTFPGTLWLDQAVDLETALEVYTIGSARAAGIDNLTGSIEVGKSADMIVVNQNPFEIDADLITKIKVDATYFAGRKVYERAQES